MALRKKELADLLYDNLGFTKKASISIVESVIDIIKEELAKGITVRISGFGKWTVKSKKERKGRNPQTGESMAICARKVITFKSSPILKDALNAD